MQDVFCLALYSLIGRLSFDFYLTFFLTNIRMDILATVLYKFSRVLTRSIYLTIKSFLCSLSFPLFSLPRFAIQG